jgi:hypothetical protein
VKKLVQVLDGSWKTRKGSTGLGVMMCLNMEDAEMENRGAVVGRTMVKVVLP